MKLKQVKSRNKGNNFDGIKWVIVLCLFFLTSITAYSQNGVVNLELKKAELSKFFDVIEKQTEYKFSYLNVDVRGKGKVSISAKEEQLKSVLTKVLSIRNLQYQVMGDKILVTAQKKDQDVQQKTKTVTGTVKDVSGVSLIGATVIEEGTTNGVITDLDGKFSLRIANGSALQISYIGYETQEIDVEVGKDITVTLEEDHKLLDEIIVVGYGTQKKVNVTGAVSQITSEELASRPVVTAAQALQGVSPGLNISTSNTYGGEVGGQMDINIRGQGSLTSGSGKPYILVDGVPMDLSLVNPSDIESVTVLKDAASAAIYGARAAFGVILVTTKRGGKNEKFKIVYDNNLAYATPTTLPRLANSIQYANAVNDASSNSGVPPVYTADMIDLIEQYMKDPTMPGILADPTDPSRWGEYDRTYANTDWYDVYYKDWTFKQSHSLSMIGGTDKSSYYVGFGLVDENGLLNFFDEKYKRYTVTINNDMKLTDWFTFKINSKFAFSDKDLPVGYGGYDRTVNYHMMARNYPTLPVYDPNGNFTESCAVAQILAEGGDVKESTTSVWLTPSFEMNLTSDLKLNGDFTYSYLGAKNLTHYAKVNVGNVDGVSTHLHHANNFSKVSEKLQYNTYATGNLYANYSKVFNKHDLSILVGGQLEYNNAHALESSVRDLITDNVPAIGTGTGLVTARDIMTEWSTIGGFGRLNYNYDNRYLIEFNGRYDGSSRFRDGKRWVFSPSLSLGYNISNEIFWESIRPVINSFKIRASYGSLGNQDVPNYLHIETLPIETNLGYVIDGERPVYTKVPALISPNLTWEESQTYNLGLDVSFLSSRLTGTFDIYERKTKNMFGPGESLPAILGAAVPQSNNASLSTRGFELTLSWRNRVNDDFSYNITTSLSDNKTEVTDYNNPTGITTEGYYKGQILGEIWGYETVGLFASGEDVESSPDQSAIYAKWNPGDIKYKDLNDDNIINWGDNTTSNPGDRKILGNSTPRFLYGFNLGMNYKDFDFSMFIQGVGKRDIFIGATTYFGFQSNKFFTSLGPHNLDYWSESNQDAHFARPYSTGENNKNQNIQSRFIQNAAYLRLKNIQIGYTLPESVLSKIKFEKVRFYVSADNLFTISSLIEGIDPEAVGGNWGNAKQYPLSATCSFGLNVVF